jgi:uncharacterized protein YndB with AHSA1/START domain
MRVPAGRERRTDAPFPAENVLKHVGLASVPEGQGIDMVVVEKSMPARAQKVFDVISDPTTYPEWLTGAKRIRRVDRDFPRPASEFEHEVGAGPLTVKDTTEVEEIRANHMLEMVVRARPFLVARVRFEVFAESGPSSHLRLSETPIGFYRLFAVLINPLIKARNTRSLNRLADYLTSAGLDARW